jgi:hypothetical protein
MGLYIKLLIMGLSIKLLIIWACPFLVRLEVWDTYRPSTALDIAKGPFSFSQNLFSSFNCQKSLRKSTLGGTETQKCTNFCGKLSFILFFTSSFIFPERLHCLLHICSLLLRIQLYYNYLEPCALNDEFQHFIPRFDKSSSLCKTLSHPPDDEL